MARLPTLGLLVMFTRTAPPRLRPSRVRGAATGARRRPSPRELSAVPDAPLSRPGVDPWVSPGEVLGRTPITADLPTTGAEPDRIGLPATSAQADRIGGPVDRIGAPGGFDIRGRLDDDHDYDRTGQQIVRLVHAGISPVEAA